MKRILSLLLSAICMFTLLGTSGCAAQVGNDVNPAETPSGKGLAIELQIGNPIMTVNGVEKEIDEGNGSVPVIVNERTLLPVRAIIEEMGGSVSWNGETREVTLNYIDKELVLTIDSTTAYLDGVAHTLDASPEIINNRTMLPIRFIAESFSFGVAWDGETQKVTITDKADEKTDVTDVETPTPTEPDGGKSGVLILYFSNTGNTKSLAEKIAKVTGGDIEEILPEVPYTSDDLNYNNSSCRANTEIQTDARPEIKDLSAALENYDTIIIGYPIWWGSCPPVIKTLLEKYDLTGKTIMPFCTSGSSGINASVSAIKELTTANVTEGFRGTSATGDDNIRTWLESTGFVVG